jgi:hypothetical protein
MTLKLRKMKFATLQRVLSLFIFLIIHVNSEAQLDTLFYFYSDFETEKERDEFTSLPSDNQNIEWDLEEEGGIDGNYPPNAASGNYNAVFSFPDPDPDTTYYRDLVSVGLPLGKAVKPQLSFQHSQIAGFGGQDTSQLFFKAGEGAPWDLIESWTSQVPAVVTGGDYWEEEIYILDEIDQKYICNDFQFRIRAYSFNENGVCVDSVVVIETDTLDYFVHQVNYSQYENKYLTTSSLQVPLIKVNLNILGNNGARNLKSVSFVLNEGEDSYFKANSFKLHLTKDEIFQNKVDGVSSQIGTSVSISSGVVTFSGLTEKMRIGDNYLWVTADIADDVEHNTPIVFGVNANSLQFNDTTVPGIAIDTILYDRIEEALFYDNFETNKGWDISSWGGDFELAIPQGLGNTITFDPDFAFSGTRVLGTDLTTDGLYEPNINPVIAYHAESPEFNLQYYDNVKLYMKKWIDFNTSDTAYISISNDGGTSWENIWFSRNDNPSLIPQWKDLFFESETDEFLSRKSNVKIRFTVYKTAGSPKAGFNIDHFTLTGNHLETDVGITEVFSPFDDCIGFGNDTVKIEIRNYAEGASPAVIPVFYALWGLDSTIVRDTIRTSIPKDGSLIFKFSELANFPRGDYYDNFTVGIDLEEDEDSSNDIIVKELYIQDSYSPPTLADFEYAGGVWIPSKPGSWQCFVPNGTIPQLPESPNSWILSRFGLYDANDTAYLTSGCYDLTNATRNIVQLKYWIQSDAGQDGMALEYSTDDGANWDLVDTTVFGRNWGWYTDDVTALGHIGWSGFSDGWVTAREMLPASLSNKNKVKFRIKWMTDNTGVHKGPAIDDFEIYSAPADVGVSSISSPKTDCELANASTTSVYVKNYGFNTMKANDTIIIGVDFEAEPAVIDTFSLASDLVPGDSVEFTVATDFDISTAGTYNIMAYTKIEDDPLFYQTSNDTAWKTFTIWPNPRVILADTIGSRDPDTVNIVPVYPDWVSGYTYEWQPGGITDSIYDVSDNGYGPRVYHVAVTEPVNGCVTNDSINVLLLYFDAGADSVVHPVSTCELTSSEIVTVRVKNTGTDSILVGDKIQVHYRVNNGTIFKDTITITETFYANQTIDYEFVNDPYDFSTIGASYNIDAWAHFGSGDTTKSNDSTYAVVETFGFTPLDLGSDLVIEDTAYTLDAGGGFVSYLWSNGDNTQTSRINTPGLYWVDAWDSNGCPANDTIDVWFKVRDILAEMLLSPVTSCEREGDNAIQFVVKNNGSDTITTAESITYSYSLNGQSRVVQTASPSADILPGSSYMYIFSEAIDMSGYQDYNFDLTVSTAGDIDINNDTLNTTVSTYPNPIVDLGSDRIVTGVQELLNADNGSGHTYQWQDNSTSSTFTAIATGEYSCTVRNITTNCTASDTVELTFDYADFSIRDITIEERPCQGNSEPLSVIIEYLQGSNARTSTTISVGYQTGSDEVVTQDVIIDELWIPGTGDAKTVELNDRPVFSENGTLPIRVYLNGMNDLNPNNDEITKDLDVQPMPVVDYGGTDTMGVYFPYILDPGLFTSYQWQDNSIDRTYTATSTGKYTVTVTNSAGCKATKSVFLSDGLYLNGAAEENLDVRLYPNPANTLLNIDVQVRTNKELKIELLDITNRVVFGETHKGIGTYSNELDVSSIIPGVYFLRIRNADIYFVNRIIIQ